MRKKNASILIVDDEPHMLEVMEAWLRPKYKCATATSAEQAALLLEDNAFDLVITDVAMPGATGLDLCSTVRDLYPDTAVIVMSAVPNLQFEVEAARQRALEFLQKPFSGSRLLASVARALHHRELLKDIERLRSPENGKA